MVAAGCLLAAVGRADVVTTLAAAAGDGVDDISAAAQLAAAARAGCMLLLQQAMPARRDVNGGVRVNSVEQLECVV